MNVGNDQYDDDEGDDSRVDWLVIVLIVSLLGVGWLGWLLWKWVELMMPV